MKTFNIVILLILALINVSYQKPKKKEDISNTTEYNLKQSSKKNNKEELKTEELTSSSECNFNNCPIGKGTCFEEICVCNTGFTTDSNKEKLKCNYELKDHSIAFFLEFFFPIGAGHFYSYRYVLGCLKLLLCSLLCIFWCGDICNLRIRFTLNSKWDKIHMACVLVNFLAFTIMHLIDLVCFGFNLYKDGNGIDMM